MAESCLQLVVLDENHSLLGTIYFVKGSVLIQKVHDITGPLCFANILIEDKFRVSTTDNKSVYSTFVFNALGTLQKREKILNLLQTFDGVLFPRIPSILT